MITLVLSFYEGVSNNHFGVVDPFLYPLFDRGSFRVFSATELSAKSLRKLEEQSTEFLDHAETSQAWQVIFILDLKKGKGTPYKDCISGKMRMIQEHFLQTFSPNNLPDNVFLILIDQLNGNHDHAFENHPDYRQCLELDRDGILFLNREKNKEKYPEASFLFTEKDLERLDQYWYPEIPKLFKSHDIALGGAYSSLREEIRNKVESKIDEIKKEVKKLLCQMNGDNITSSEAKPGNFINSQIEGDDYLIDEKTISRILKDFDSNLELIRKDTVTYETFRPSEKLKESFRRYVSMYALDNSEIFKMLRLNFQTHKTKREENLLKLAMLIFVLSDDDIANDLKKENPYKVEIDLNRERLVQFLNHYKKKLGAERESLKKETSLNPPIELELYQAEGDNNHFNHALNGLDPIDNQLKPNPNIKSMVEWDHWNDHIETYLNRHLAAVKKRVAESITQSESYEYSSKIEEFTSIKALKEKRTQLNQLLISKRDALQEQEEYHPLEFDWRSIQRKYAPIVEKQIEDHPDFTGLIRGVIPLLFLFLLSALIPFAGWIGLIVSLLLPTALIAYQLSIISRRHKKNLRNILNRVYIEMKAIKEHLETELTRQVKQEQMTCQIKALRENFKRVDKEWSKWEESGFLKEYHSQQLKMHQDKADQLLGCFRKDRRNIPETDYFSRPDKMKIEAPIFQNDVYSPVSYLPEEDSERKDFKLLQTDWKFDSQYKFLIKHLHFKEDRIYNNPRKSLI